MVTTMYICSASIPHAQLLPIYTIIKSWVYLATPFDPITHTYLLLIGVSRNYFSIPIRLPWSSTRSLEFSIPLHLGRPSGRSSARDL